MPVTAVQPVFVGNGIGKYGRQLLGADEKANVSAIDRMVVTTDLRSRALSGMEKRLRCGLRLSFSR